MKRIFTILVAVVATLSAFGQNETFVEIGGVKYRTVVMKDGREWMAENLRYVPEGKTVTPLNDWSAENNTGVWYPAEFSIVESKAVITPSDSEESIKKMGLLYSSEVVMGGALPTTDFKDADNIQGIAPEGWHVPTAQEWIDLVGACSANNHNNTEAPYYDSTLAGASLEALNKDGFNLMPYPYINQSKSYLGSYLNKREGNEYNTYCSMTYFASSTGRSATQSYAALITNNNTKTSVNCAYNFFTNGVFVRFIKDKESTGISQIETENLKKENPVIYNLAGQRVKATSKGINIINGVKVIVK